MGICEGYFLPTGVVGFMVNSELEERVGVLVYSKW